MPCLKQAEQAQIKANHHNDQEHDEDKEKESFVKEYVTSTALSPDQQRDMTRDKRGCIGRGVEEKERAAGVWVRNESTGQIK